MQATQAAPLRPGIHVQLKCGSPLLRVLRAGRDLVVCAWVDAKRPRPIKVPPHYLVIAH